MRINHQLRTRSIMVTMLAATILSSALPSAAHAAPATPLLCGTERYLQLFWSAARGDNFTTATAAGAIEARNVGYTFVRSESPIWSQQVAGTVPLKQYWSAERGDNFVTATAAGQLSAVQAGYQLVRTEGYVSPNYSASTPVPLKLFWNADRGDNFTTSSAIGEQNALAAGYQLVRIEGFVPARCAP